MEHASDLLTGLLASGGNGAQIVMAVLLWRMKDYLRALSGDA